MLEEEILIEDIFELMMDIFKSSRNSVSNFDVLSDFTSSKRESKSVSNFNFSQFSNREKS